MKNIKKTIFVGMALILSFGCSACKKEKTSNIALEPQIAQMKSICELATMDCYFHNVAKYYEEDAQGSLWWKKDKHFWIEYSGVVKLGIDVSAVNIEVDEDVVTITLPAAKVLGYKVDETTLTESSFIIEAGSADVKAEDQTRAYAEAQKNMVEVAENDSALLASAQQRAQVLLDDYVKNIGNAVGKEYKTKWIYLDSDGKKNSNAGKEESKDSDDESISAE